jgi:hypothetical protein
MLLRICDRGNNETSTFWELSYVILSLTCLFIYLAFNLPLRTYPAKYYDLLLTVIRVLQ